MLHDVIILGAGPAGLTAGLYASRAGLKTAIIEKGQIGGQISLTLNVENYPGVFGKEVTGPNLTEIMLEQAMSFGCEKITDEIISIEIKDKIKILKSKNVEYRAKSLIYATGANPRKLGLENEDKYTGKGIAYCATCDGAFYQGADIYVVGGGDAALEEAIFLTKFGKKVIVLNRSDKLRATKIIQDRAFSNNKIEIRYNTEVKKINGGVFLESLELQNNKTGEKYVVTNEDGDPDIGLFIFVGYNPNTELVKGLLELERGYVKASENTKTNIEGIFVAGDVRTKSIRQVVTATSDGAVAAIECEKYIESL